VGKRTLVITRVRVLHFTKQYKDTLQMRLMILMSVCLFQIYHGICVPISIQIKKDMMRLLQKQNGAVFYASQCILYVCNQTASFDGVVPSGSLPLHF